MSPVNDAYSKPGLAPARHRVAMCQMAAADSSIIMVDGWEAAQPQYQRSLAVLRHVSSELKAGGMSWQLASCCRHLCWQNAAWLQVHADIEHQPDRIHISLMQISA